MSKQKGLENHKKNEEGAKRGVGDAIESSGELVCSRDQPQSTVHVVVSVCSVSVPYRIIVYIRICTFCDVRW